MYQIKDDLVKKRSNVSFVDFSKTRDEKKAEEINHTYCEQAAVR